MSCMVNKIKKEIERSNPGTGMLCGHSKVTLDVADVERLFIEIDTAKEQLVEALSSREELRTLLFEAIHEVNDYRMQSDTVIAEIVDIDLAEQAIAK